MARLMHLTLQLFGATIVDLHIRDDDEPDPLEEANRDTEPWPIGFTSGGQHMAHTELAGVQVEPLTEGEPYDCA